MRLRAIFIIALICLLHLCSSAQRVSTCGYIIPPKSLKSSFTSVYEATDVVQLMLDSVKWKENFKLKEQNGINNAYATISNNMRWIVYDNNFLENLDAYAATKWASISVMAHEVGHHYFNHVLKNTGSTISTELEADKFSGYVMQRLGASLVQAKAAMEKIGTPNPTSTHPAKRDRLVAIENGWNMAYNQINNTTNTNTGTTKPTTPTTPTAPTAPTNPGAGTTQTNTDPATDPSWIALYMQNSKTETIYLSDDGRSFQQVQMKVNEPFVFKFEIYNYGWLRLKYYNGYRTFKLFHGKDYTILWNRRTKNWTIVEVPN